MTEPESEAHSEAIPAPMSAPMSAPMPELNSVPVTAVIFTLNEAVNLPHCLASLARFDEVVIVDSFSTDETQAIAAEFGASFYQNPFTGFGDQRNWALDNLSFRNDWLLILDADECVTPDMERELTQKIQSNPVVGAYQLRRRFYMWGRWLRYSSLYPTWVVRVIHRQRVRYENRGHSETQTIEGKLASLEHDLIDENHKGIDEWFERQNRYASREAEYELSFEQDPLPWGDVVSSDALVRRHALKRLSWRIPARAIVYFFYAYLLRLGFLDGIAGYRFCLMKAAYQHTIVVKKAELLANREAENV